MKPTSANETGGSETGGSETGGSETGSSEYARERKQIERQRQGLLRSVSGLLDVPMTILSFIWVLLLILDFTGGMTESLQLANTVIWTLFILHFALEFWIAPRKLKYLKSNWLTAFALVLPAFRLLRAWRALRLLQTMRFGRSINLLRWMTSMNRGMRATRRTLRERGLTYVLALTVLVIFAGAAGIYVFENPGGGQPTAEPQASASTGIRSYGEAIWWTAMMLTTMGTDYFPRTTEGRILAWVLAVYAFAIFGYITATVASLIIRVDSDKHHAASRRLERRDEIQATLQKLLERLERIEQQLETEHPDGGRRGALPNAASPTTSTPIDDSSDTLTREQLPSAQNPSAQNPSAQNPDVGGSGATPA
jgi:voltage-gated potassium channel